LKAVHATQTKCSELVNANGGKRKAQLYWEEWPDGDALPGPIAVKDQS